MYTVKRKLKTNDERKRKKKKTVVRTRFCGAITNVVLSAVLLMLSAVCLSDSGDPVSAVGETDVYRNGVRGTDCVSLMFNVYENTEIVCDMSDILIEYGAKATFFVGGCWADDNARCIQKLVRDGHEIGNHGYFHKDHATLSFQANKTEISSCNRVVEAFTGKKPVLFAPPSGAYGKDCIRAAEEEEMKTVLWSRDTIDWRDKDAALVFKRATSGVKGGDLVLMHPKEHTLSALKDVLVYYKNHSLRVVTVSENLSSAQQSS